MRPDHGGRFVLRLDGEYAECLDYELALYVPDAEWRTRARLLRVDGSVALDPWPGEPAPPSWLCDAARAALRTAWRGCHTDPAASWPRRLTRWRPGPAQLP